MVNSSVQATEVIGLKTGIVGLGLIGGSFARAYSATGHEVYALEKNPQVFDAAGNMKEYRFVILTYFTVSSLIFIALAVVILVSIGIYILIKRKNLRIG